MMNIKMIYDYIRFNHKDISEVDNLWKKRAYYRADIECYGDFINDRACQLCKGVKRETYNKCKKDNEIWKFLMDCIAKG